MTDFLMWILVIALMSAKLVLYGMLIILAWVLIKEYNPSIAKSIKDKIPNYKKESE